MIHRRTYRFLYLLMLIQPLPALFVVLDSRLNWIDIPRSVVMLAIALSWGVAAITLINALEDRGLNVGRPWVKWTLAAALAYAVHFFARQEIYLIYIVPINLIVIPLLILFVTRLALRADDD